MLDDALAAFEVQPDHDLNVMQPGQTLFESTSRILAALENVLKAERPDIVLVQGDTTTTLCGALAAFYSRIAVGHVEAGLRTGDMSQPFPEEMNRVLTGRLAGEGLPALDLSKKLIVVTAHRRESFGDGFERICAALARLAGRPDVEIVYPVHRNPNVREPALRRLGGLANVRLIEPLDYVPFVNLMRKAYLLITDSGGIQEEGPSLGKPVLVMRDKTERPEAVLAGTVKLVGADENAIVTAASRLIENRKEYEAMARVHNPYGDGHASIRISDAIHSFFSEKSTREPVVSGSRLG
jgi:UDP-N-acetylglucosamine 2-epimerase (non-hydrolysing)